MFDRGPYMHGGGAACAEDWRRGYAIPHSFLRNFHRGIHWFPMKLRNIVPYLGPKND